MSSIRARKILVADLLCGAGGSSTGCARALAALGLKMELVCLNHWPVAIETHKRNHPEARHYVEDISTVRPHLLVPEGYLDLLMASPTCTHHSVARGGKPASDQQRSDPWHIVTCVGETKGGLLAWQLSAPRNARPHIHAGGGMTHETPLLPLNQAIAAVEADMEAKIASATSERERQYYALIKAVYRPWHEWAHTAVHCVEPQEFIRIVAIASAQKLKDAMKFFVGDARDENLELLILGHLLHALERPQNSIARCSRVNA